MPKQEIEEFARKLIYEVRDKAIRSCDNILDPEAKGVVAKRWRAEFGKDSCFEFGKTIIPDCVDNVVFHLLNAIDSGLLPLTFTAADGSSHDLVSAGEGEMAGWYMASGEWRARYSGQRFVDDFEDM
jgi:hypothetical protein